MAGSAWLRALGLTGLVIVSMLLGGVITAEVVEPPPSTPVAEGTPPPATQQPVRRAPDEGGETDQTAEQESGAFASTNLPDVIDAVRRSVVRIEGSGGGFGQSVGSGVVIDTEGHILTNYHVIEGAYDLKVMLWDGSASDAEVLGIDPGSDLAVVKISVDAEQLNPAVFGDSDEVRVGEQVFAIGNPFSQQFSVTSGIISATGRVTRSSFTGRSIRDVIQTDTAVNPGNSGGPLFNLQGDVVGINTSIENPNGRFFVGLGFAVPSNTAMRFLPEMLEGNQVHHPQLGVGVQPLDSMLAEDAGVEVNRGLYVETVSPGSSAEAAGLVPGHVFDGGQLSAGGDVIVAIDGDEVNSFEDLARAVDRREVGELLELTVVRGSETIEVTVALQAWPSD